MPIISSAGRLTEVDRRSTSWNAAGSVSLYNGLRQTYAQIVKSQPNVRTVISFLARNLAQLNAHLYERVSDTDRRRAPADHPFEAALRRPNPLDRRMTRYRLFHATVSDLCAYDVAYWALVNAPGAARPGIVKLPAGSVKVIGDSPLWPDGYELTGNRGTLPLPPEAVVHFQGSLNLEDPLAGLSPIETLRRILSEEAAANEYREQYWRSGARISGVIERPTDAPPWSDTARTRFRKQWTDAYTGSGDRAGGTPILEDGMTFKETAGTARDAQYLEARKLTREEVAAAFHVHPAFVGILEHANFANMREQHRSLYMDTLGPWVKMLEEDLMAQALPAFVTEADLDRFYVEFNIADKLRGSVEELAASIISLTGRPVLTANEGRALLNRNALDDGDGLVIPLNVLVGGQTDPGVDPVDSAGTRSLADLDELHRILEAKVAGPSSSSPPPSSLPSASSSTGTKAIGLPDRTRGVLRNQAERLHRRTLTRTFERQARAVLSAYGAARPGAGADELFNRDRFDLELFADLYAVAREVAGLYAVETANALGFDDLELDVLDPWLRANAEYAASNINATTVDGIAKALLTDDPGDALGELFTVAAGGRALQIAATRTTAVGNFASVDTARQSGRGSKVWRVYSRNPRPSHASINGEEVPLGTLFSLGGAFPGDSAMGVDEVAGCTCGVEFI